MKYVLTIMLFLTPSDYAGLERSYETLEACRTARAELLVAPPTGVVFALAACDAEVTA